MFKTSVMRYGSVTAPVIPASPCGDSHRERWQREYEEARRRSNENASGLSDAAVALACFSVAPMAFGGESGSSDSSSGMSD
jgi:hypothetical protein